LARVAQAKPHKTLMGTTVLTLCSALLLLPLAAVLAQTVAQEKLAVQAVAVHIKMAILLFLVELEHLHKETMEVKVLLAALQVKVKVVVVVLEPLVLMV
jgi:hypothetical protein